MKVSIYSKSEIGLGRTIFDNIDSVELRSNDQRSLSITRAVGRTLIVNMDEAVAITHEPDTKSPSDL